MPRYVILRHETPPTQRGTHWDLMLETDGVLRTWALAKEPSPKQEITADALADHRIDYLDYEGPISQNRGTVTQWDAGEYELLTNSPTELQVKLQGRRLIGKARLQRTAKEDQRWIFCFSS